MHIAVTTYCLGRYNTHHPGASRQNVEKDLQKTTPIDTSSARSLAGHRPRNNNDRFLLSHDCQGVFIVNGHHVAVTYLRLGEDACRTAIKQWGTTSQQDALEAQDDLTRARNAEIRARHYKTLFPGLTDDELKRQRDAARSAVRCAERKARTLRIEITGIKFVLEAQEAPQEKLTRKLETLTRQRIEIIGQFQDLHDKASILGKALRGRRTLENLERRRANRINRINADARETRQTAEVKPHTKEPHPDLGMPAHQIKIEDNLRDAFGGSCAARRALACMTKTDSCFNRETWTQTITLQDPTSHLKVNVHIPHSDRNPVCAEIA